MKHIDALVEYINQALNESEKAYLIKHLDSDNGQNDSANRILNHVCSGPVNLVQSPIAETLQSEFPTLSKRSVKYLVIKKKLLIQKPKTVITLQNFIKHIGQSEGGFSDVVIGRIIENLTQEHLLKVDEYQSVIWLK